MEKSLGSYIVYLRKQKSDIKTIKGLVEKLEITPQYLNDIENNKRVPSSNLLKKIVHVFELDEKQKIELYDLASNSYKEKKVPADIATFIIENEDAKDKIRAMMEEYRKETE